MKISRRPMLTTIIYGLLAGMAFMPMVMVTSSIIHWTAAFRLTIWFVLAGYLVILTRWGKVSLLSIFFPLLLLLLLVFWGDTNSAFLFLALGVLSWARSGICFQGSLLKTLVTEVALSLGAGTLVVFFAPHSTITWGVAVWMFFLVQSVYFVVFEDFGNKQEERAAPDPFHQARTQAERILSTSP
ncbi:MAG: hypothetical protein LJE88_12505 [Deltaproteobacteria bacterium]|nr:hypothetical protein [Deltaproteobacteria bacterium]